MVIETPDKTPLNCLDVKKEMSTKLKEYASSRLTIADLPITLRMNADVLNQEKMVNLFASSLLANKFVESHEGPMGLQKGAVLPTTGGRFFQYLNRAKSWDGFLSLFSAFGGKSLQGASLAAERAQEFGENLARAPHLAGFIKMALIAIFPWLVFFVVAGKWRVLVSWYMIYFSVLLWTPIWTLLYHIMTGITLSSEMMGELARFNDGVSVYASHVIGDRIYHMFEVYSWLQILLGTLFTGTVLYFMRPMLTDGQAETAPDFLDDTYSQGSKVVSTVGKAVKAGAGA